MVKCRSTVPGSGTILRPACPVTTASGARQGQGYGVDAAFLPLELHAVKRVCPVDVAQARNANQSH
jgi:hypothetical protein